MSESSFVPMVSYLGWTFLPNLLTNWIQTIYYRITIQAGSPQPQPGTAIYTRDHKRTRIIVLSLYLLYTLAQSLYDVKLAGDFYTLLSVDPYTTTDKEIKSRLRRLAAKFHPDKISSSEATTDTDSLFVKLRLASETLTNPSHKYAYTHFGPSIVTHLPRPTDNSPTQTPKQISLQTAELILTALRQKIPSYIINILFVLILNTFFLPARSSGKFWRYLIITSSFVLELYLLTHDIPALPSTLETALTYLRTYTTLGSILPPHLLPYQILEITSRLTLSLNIFISQVSVLFPSTAPPSITDAAEMRNWMAQLTSSLSLLNTTSQRLDGEASTLLQLQFAPYRGQARHVGELRRGMKEGMVLGGVRGHPEVKEAVQRVIEIREGRRRRKHEEDRMQREDGADVVDLLASDEQFI
ncbi:hypothetical protein LTR64_006783 [Lithohypha guttulata]|uniref:uncharacterized protein n=1 Tax=Lithohypha guttulata TaxID=1690604 RepID=UPI002DDE393B|nr:hypothetical protein LTR51_004659 [Lithohypha guttulata]